MFMAANISSRTKFLRCLRTASAVLSLISIGCLFRVQELLYGPDYGLSRPFGVGALVLLLVPAGVEWTADAFIDREVFPLADKLFTVLPWVYSSVLVGAASFGVLYFKEASLPNRNRLSFRVPTLRGFARTSSRSCVP